MSNDPKSPLYVSPRARAIYDLCLAAGVSERAMRYIDGGMSVAQVRMKLFPNQQANGHDQTALDQHG